MFEKDVLQLIRGMRAHKGQEREYIQGALRECRKEIKSQDMDAKAVALLKLVYLEMFGHDMSWASFNVLEVMSSQKFLPKRVGYLAAAQTFRPDTEVLMLAENLLKKDLGSTDKNTISLTLATIPHLVNPGMANSLLTDLLPRMSHSDPRIRKKTIVTIYRLALVYPEVLRPAWPKVKERLLDENEDPSVTAAIVNVVCELGWRRPQEFLSLAPRLFDLLTEGHNNWMAIKIIKLFSVLTPVEPRLVKKLLPPLTQLIKTTAAMSLLYECINGIIQGGIMEAAEGTREGDEIARLCTEKLRGMLLVKDDPNLRYVALLAFNKITISHPHFVADHEAVLVECMDDSDISIRTRALDLIIGMINPDNLQLVVDKLLNQLRSAGFTNAADDPSNDRGTHDHVEPLGDEDDEDVQQSLRQEQHLKDRSLPLPEHYRALVIERILEICSKNTYTNLRNFEWYVTVLVRLVKECPPDTSAFSAASTVGDELLNLAVRVKDLRQDVVAAAQSLLLSEQSDAAQDRGWPSIAGSVAFIAGEYAKYLTDAASIITALSNPANDTLPSDVLATYLQAIPKVFAHISASDRHWKSPMRRTEVELLLARIIHFLEPLTLHPALEVQERAVEYRELFKLASQAAKSSSEEDDQGEARPPLLFSQAIPALFAGSDLNPVATTAVQQVPVPEDLDLDAPINASLGVLLRRAEHGDDADILSDNDMQKYYYEKPVRTRSVVTSQKPAELLAAAALSYQETAPQVQDQEVFEKKRAERRERYKDDPYYIDSERNSGSSTPLGSTIRSVTNGDELDVEAIPVMKLQLSGPDPSQVTQPGPEPRKKTPIRRFQITGDETPENGSGDQASASSQANKSTRSKRGLLDVGASGLASFNLEGESGSSALDIERRAQEELEMARAMKEVERLRLAMQRRSEEIPETSGGEVITVKRTKKKARTGIIGSENGSVPQQETLTETPKKKKKKKPKDHAGNDVDATEVKTERKKKRVVTFEETPG